MPKLPISNALTEALSDSISELFNRDVEGLTDQDLDRIIVELRANRERYEAAEAAGIKNPRTVRRLDPKRVVPDIKIASFKDMKI